MPLDANIQESFLNHISFYNGFGPRKHARVVEKIKKIEKIKKTFPSSQADRLGAWLAGGLTGWLAG